MKHVPSPRSAAALLIVTFGMGIWAGCSDRGPDSLTAPDTGDPGLRVQQGQPDLERALSAQLSHTESLLGRTGVVGTAVGLLPDGRAGVRIFVEHPDVQGLPNRLDGVPAAVEVTGRFMAISDPTTRERPAPVGFSVGHQDITAGTIGARVKGGAGGVYILSNNHVLANANEGNVGDPVLQPGPADGGTAADQIASLTAYKPIDFSADGQNTMDAAIAQSSTADLSHATPTDDGYGAPSSTIFGDGDGDGFFDDESALLGLEVQKYGRTTKLTHGEITGINATLQICYEVVWIWCTKSAYFTDQLVIEPGTFSDRGDSGSLIVTDDEGRRPVGLLFAGSSTQTIANRIDLVLDHFGMTVDGEEGEPPPAPDPVTDVAIEGVSAPASVEQGSPADVDVTVQNAGNQDVTTTFGVTLTDATDDVTIGTQSVSALAAGESTTLTFTWTTGSASTGTHTLRASHDLADDDDPTNDQASTTVEITSAPSPGSRVHVGDLDGLSLNYGSTWAALVDVTVHDESHVAVSGAVVVGSWSPGGLASDECTTGTGGTCTVLYPSIRKRVGSVTFTVTSVAVDGETYDPAANHDPDGSSDGTTITVNKP